MACTSNPYSILSSPILRDVIFASKTTENANEKSMFTRICPWAGYSRLKTHSKIKESFKHLKA